MYTLKECELDQLIRMIKDGSGADEAFCELLSRYDPLIRSRVNTYFGSSGNDSEAQQEASIALHNAAVTYDRDKCEGVTFGLYASICISNRLKSLLRERARRSKQTDDSFADKLAVSSNIEAKIAAGELCERVMRAARSVLSDFEYEVFRLGFEQYTTADIAKTLGRTPKSVDNAKFRISRRLRNNEEIRSILSEV